MSTRDWSPGADETDQKGNTMKIKHLTNANGNPVMNHFVYYCEEGNCDITALQSYDSLVVKIVSNSCKDERTIYFGSNVHYSATTTRHVNKFMRDEGFPCLGSRQAREKAVEAGKIKGVKVVQL